LSGQITSTLEILVTNLYISSGLLGIVLVMAIESCCLPLPGEIVMPVAGILLAQGKILDIPNPVLGLLLVGLAGASGCLLGSMVAYGIGYRGGRPLMLKYGRSMLISQHDADGADKFFQRWGTATIFFSRLLPVMRSFIALPAGIAKMPFDKFCVYTFLGSFPFCLLLAYLGTILGNNLGKFSSVFRALDVIIVIALAILIVLYVYRHASNDRKIYDQAQPSQQLQQQGWKQLSSQQRRWGQTP